MVEKQNTFFYKYSAKENREIEEIRKRYLSVTESELDEIKRLDSTVKTAGITEALSVGIVGALIFGFGMCLAMHVVGNSVLSLIAGVILGVVGAVIMVAAYPTYSRIYGQTKEKLAPRILELADILTSKENQN